MSDRVSVFPTVFALAILLLVSISPPITPSAWAQAAAGSISAISGTATIQRAGATIPAAYGTKVNVGDKIVTAAASNVTITLSPPIYPRNRNGTDASADASGWHELIRLRDATRDAIVRHTGEPLL